jgi:hypothetical protein
VQLWEKKPGCKFEASEKKPGGKFEVSEKKPGGKFEVSETGKFIHITELYSLTLRLFSGR